MVRKMIPARRKCPPQDLLAIILSLSLSLGALASFAAPGVAAPFQKVVTREPSDQDIEQMRSIAEAQFEIVKILIKQGRFDRVLPEMKKIYDLNMPERFEQATAESVSIAADMLVQRSQFEIAHQVLDEAFGHMRRNESKAAILKVNAYVYKSEGNLDKAFECFERAVALERQSGRP